MCACACGAQRADSEVKDMGVGTMVFQAELGYEVDLFALHQANPFDDKDKEVQVKAKNEIPVRFGTQYNSEVTPRLTCRFRNTNAILNVYQSGKLNIVGILVLCSLLCATTELRTNDSLRMLLYLNVGHAAVRSKAEAEKMLELLCPVLVQFRDNRTQVSVNTDAGGAHRYLHNRMAAHVGEHIGPRPDRDLSPSHSLALAGDRRLELPRLEQYRELYRTATAANKSVILNDYIKLLFSPRNSAAYAPAPKPPSSSSSSAANANASASAATVSIAPASSDSQQ